MHFTPGDSIVLGKIGLLGYYSDLHIYDRSGLVDRRVAMRPRTRNPLRMPGHDSKVSTNFFFADEPTVVLHERLDGPPPSRKNPEYPLLRRVRMKAESWRKFSIWRRYVPEVLPLKPSPDGSPNVLMVLRLIEEEPRVATLPRPERVATRTKRAEKAWNDFFAGLDSALLSDISFAYFEGGDIGGKVLAQAELWRTLLQPSLWRSYVPGLVELVGRPEPEAHHVMMVLRLIGRSARRSDCSSSTARSPPGACREGHRDVGGFFRGEPAPFLSKTQTRELKIFMRLPDGRNVATRQVLAPFAVDQAAVV